MGMEEVEQYIHPEDDSISASPHDFELLKDSPAWKAIEKHLEEVRADVYSKLLRVTTERELGKLQGEGNLIKVVLSLPDFLAELKEAQLNNVQEDG